ncbi:MAG: c-type cytochrome [Bacteroidetes bacterium]|nr:c-type cytochrome [Bacteroidota bacterium]
MAEYFTPNDIGQRFMTICTDLILFLRFTKNEIMYTTILLIHRIVVTLFLLHYMTKLILLLFNKKELLASYSQKTRLVEIVISTTFLISGGWLMFSGALFNNLLIIKLICVFAAIPLAVIGFKKGNKVLAISAVFLVLAAYGLAEMNKKGKTGGKMDTTTFAGDPIAEGQFIYGKSCVKCHGADGKMGGSGSKDLSLTTLTDDEKRVVIRQGRNAMPGYKDLTDVQVESVIQYINTIKK